MSLRNPPVQANLVAPNLFVGSFPPSGRYRWVSVIVLCAKELQPSSVQYPGVLVIHAPLDDDPRRELTEIEAATAIRTAKTVARYLATGNRVLVTCAMGLNRSALVAGLAMLIAYDMPADAVIERIRAQRDPQAFGNPMFRRFLRGVDSAKHKR